MGAELFKKQIDVILYNPDGASIKIIDHTMEPYVMRCKGTINRYPGTQKHTLDINLYNLPSSIRGEIGVGTYSCIAVYFGYETANNFSQIFNGNIVRPRFSKPDASTSVTTLYCWDSGEFNAYGVFSGAFDNGVNYYEIAESIINSNSEFGITGDLADKLKNYSPNGNRAYFDSPQNILSEIAEASGCLLAIENNVAKLYDPLDAETATVTIFNKMTDGRLDSTSGLVGIPQLTSEGLSFECLINPALKIYSWVGFDNSTVSNNQTGAVPQNIEAGATYDSSGLYRIVSMEINFSNDGELSSASCIAKSRDFYISNYGKVS